MAVLNFGQPKTAKQTKKKPTPGSFSLESDELDWKHCREEFARIYDRDVDGFYFSHNTDQGENVAAFISKIEDILDIEFRRTEYAKTNLNFALWIAPSPFWGECKMKKSLFTILLRAGLVYNPETDNFEEALYGEKYAAPTKNAVQRFLFGNTRYIGDDSVGWVSFFAEKNGEKYKQKSLDFVREHLVAPKREEIIFAAGSIWG